MKRRTSLLALGLAPLANNAVAGVMDWFTGVTVGTRLPKFDAEYLEAEPRTDYKLLLVDFWATWCGPCRNEFPHINALHEAFAPRGLEVIGLTKEAKAVALGFLPKVSIRYKLGAGGVTPLQVALGIRALPYAILVNRSNIIIWRGQASELSAADVERYLSGAA